MIRAWIYPHQVLSIPPQQLKKAVVREYFSGRLVGAEAVTWVTGSDVAGPMGAAMVPLSGDRHLAAFLRRHGGRHTFVFSELSETLWQKITETNEKP
jgi:nitrous oxide reductase accessory protein NosL